MGVHPVGVRARPLDPVITVWKAAEGVAVVVAAVEAAAEIATAAATPAAAAVEIATAAVAAAEAGPAHPEPEVMEAITLVVMEAGPMWTGSIVKLLILFILSTLYVQEIFSCVHYQILLEVLTVPWISLFISLYHYVFSNSTLGCQAI